MYYIKRDDTYSVNIACIDDQSDQLIHPERSGTPVP